MSRKLIPRKGTVIKWGEEEEKREITLYPFATSAAFAIVESIAHIIDELNKEGVNILEMLKNIPKDEKTDEEVDKETEDKKIEKLLKSIFAVLPVVVKNAKDDFDRLIINSTDDVDLEEIRARETRGLAYDFDEMLYLHLIENIVVVNESKWVQWATAASSMMDKLLSITGEKVATPEKPTLSLGRETEEVQSQTTEGEPEKKPKEVKTVMTAGTAGESITGNSSG